MEVKETEAVEENSTSFNDELRGWLLMLSTCSICKHPTLSYFNLCFAANCIPVNLYTINC